MRITEIETFTVGAGWKNWLFVKVHTDAGVYGVGEGTLNGFIATTEAGVQELKHLAIGQDPRRINSLSKRMLDSVSLDGGHIHRTIIAANGAMQRLIVMPPNVPKEASEALTRAIQALEKDPDYASETDKVLGYQPDFVTGPVVNERVRRQLTIPTGTREFLANYVKNAPR